MLPLIIVSAIVVLIFLIAGVYALAIWITRRRYTRERFAFVSLSAITSLTFTFGAAVAFDFTPWYVIAALVKVVFGEAVPLPEPRFIDLAFLALFYLVAVGSMLVLHAHWDGLKSVEHHRKEQRSEFTGLLAEGLGEIGRIAKGRPPPEPHVGEHLTQFIDQLEPVSESLAWKDQARDLVRLTSSSYAFDAASGWHDIGGCWVGTNLDTGDPVILYPTQSSVSQAQLTAFLSYADRVAPGEAGAQAELIVATKDDTATAITPPNGRRIRFETESTLLDNLVNFTDYRNEVIRRVELECLPDSELSLKDVYAPSRLLASSVAEPKPDIEEYLMKWVREPGRRQLALLGEYGQGKSTAALMFTYRFFCSGLVGSNRIPLLVELRGTSPRNLTPLALLGAWAAKYRMEPQALMRLLVAGRLLLIFEGFDEMALVGDAEMRLKHFKTLWQFCYPKAKILITGRPNFFLDEEEMKAALGIRKRAGNRPYCEAIRLAPFGADQITAALRAHKRSVRNQIAGFAARNTRFYELISRPSLLQIVSVLWERERLFESVEELTSARVMDVFVRHSYRRQGAKEAESPEFMALTTSERQYFMEGIASYMAANHLPNQISAHQLSELIDHLIEAIPDSVSSESTAISGETTRPLRLRLQGSEHGVEHVKTDVRACGLLVDDPTAPGTFHFGHKSFMEYLLASVLAERIENQRSAKARAVLRVTGAAMADVLGSPESVHFLSELVGARVTKAVMSEASTESADTLVMQRSIARRLLKTISGRNRLNYIVLRQLAFFWVSIRATPPPWGSRNFLPLLGTAIMIMLLSPLWLAELLDPAVYLSKRGSFSARLALWERICRELDIKGEVLHEVVGTNLLPWVKKQPFQIAASRSFAKRRVPSPQT